MTINQTFQEWELITDEPGESFIFEHISSGKRVRLDKDGGVHSSSVDADDMDIARLRADQVSVSSGGGLGSRLRDTTPTFVPEHITDWQNGFDPDIYHRDLFGDSDYRITVTDGTNTDTDLYRTSDFQTFTQIDTTIFDDTTENRVNDHIILPDGRYAVYVSEDQSETRVWTGTDLTDLTDQGQVFSYAADLGAYLDESGTIHLYSEESGVNHANILEHYTTTTSDLTSKTQQTDAIDVSSRTWELGDVEIITLGGQPLMFSDRYEGADADNYPYRIAIFTSDDLYNWRIRTDRLTPRFGGDMTVVPFGGQLRAITEGTNEDGGNSGTLASWKLRLQQGDPLSQARQAGFHYQFNGAEPAGSRTEFTSGAGSVVQNEGYLRVQSGSTSGGHATARRPGSPTPITSWEGRRVLTTDVDFDTLTGPLYIVSGVVGESNKGTEHFGFAATSGDLIATVGNGSGQQTTTLISSPGTNQVRLRAEFSPANKVDYYVNGVLEGSITSGLPSGTTEANILWNSTVQESGGVNRILDIYHIGVAQEASYFVDPVI